ncbi:MAG: Methanogenesis marker protein 1 [Methanomicrobiales archaeon 53_19]|jgi:ribosomal protein S12 methylthiotransferase accessory factor|uniref:YcaO-related McrA-glycine thioamidation protein n=1 Tax=Methanocalculus sp. TaxID=2004547 RepID=UPI00074A1E78|nr:YcaO-related McrA-glycine thioamidation protein [Methanocalculus sp.]KUK71192.1 MAG: Methanogenesis marker protein 1 [Methanocalculus sp. 52_23]KUL04735.1 MAG: Methanogenesis marker protein 1 [Methanomicrobiales archaeon 53_19]HIJ06951.1 YcaO-related McrA-glycine thioamidation protein [Methanocalculus sp.]
MQLKTCPKGYMIETHRAVSPELTLERIEPLLPQAGITRVADITGLDRLGIPVFSCIRPTAEGGAISVYNGKGATPVAARVSAIMEGIERCSAEMHSDPVKFGRYSDISREMAAVDPVDLILPAGADRDAAIPWAAGYDIINNEEVLLPAHAVYHPLSHVYRPLHRTNTNGIASGNTLEEAIIHGLLEVIERDAWSLVEASRYTGNRIIDITDPISSSIINRFSQEGVDLILRDITSDIGIPTCAAVADDTVLCDPALLVTGMGTHTAPEIALLRALTEVAQSRLTQIHGAREDTVVADMRRQIGYERTKRLNGYWFRENGDIPFERMPGHSSDDLLTDIRYVCDRIVSAGFDRVIVSDLTRPDIGIPVVRVVVPGLEVYAMDQDRIGERCRNARRSRLPRPKSSS